MHRVITSRVITNLAAAAALTLGVVAAGSSAQAAPTAPTIAGAKTFKNCTQLNKTYPHGVGRPGAHDKTSGTPVRNFKVSKPIYQANTKSDRDKDGIACEKQ